MPLPSGPALLTLTRVYWLSAPVVESVIAWGLNDCPMWITPKLADVEVTMRFATTAPVTMNDCGGGAVSPLVSLVNETMPLRLPVTVGLAQPNVVLRLELGANNPEGVVKLKAFVSARVKEP